MSEEELNQAIDRLIRDASPYPNDELEGMIADMSELESYGVKVVRTKKSDDLRELLQVVVRGSGNLASILEERWKESLRLSHESYHSLSVGRPVTLRFVTLGGVGYITGRIVAEANP